MLDRINNTTPVEQASVLDYEELSRKYDALLTLYSVRTFNVLKSMEQRYASKREFLYYFTKMTASTIRAQKNCGAKTVDEILAIQYILNPTHEGVSTGAPAPLNHDLPNNADNLLPLVMPRLEGLSVRAKNGFLLFLEEKHNSLTEIYKAVSNPKFNPGYLKNVGKGTIGEIKGLLDGIKVFLESFTDEQSVNDAINQFNRSTLDDLQIPVAEQDMLRELEGTLGRFPLFAAIKAYLEGMEGEDRVIIDGLFEIREGQALREREDIAVELGISNERVRQKRNKLIESLAEYFATYRSLGFVDKCDYNYQMRHINEDINAEEGTDYNLNFVNWVLASTFEDVTLLGDAVKAITGFYEMEHSLCLVPTDLCQFMDFNAFIKDVETRLAEKRIDEEKVGLRSLISSHLKVQYCEDEMPNIETACRSILYLHYPVEVDFGQVIFKPNARKNNPIIFEEIIRAAGHPLTLEEIYEEFIYQYPERYTEMKSIRGGINNNPNIIPIGRSSTYTLAEWESDNHKGGTIRQIVCDYLDSIDGQLAKIDDVVEYVRRFRPTSNESSISSNLLQEQNHKFSIFVKDGVRYLGYTGVSYDSSFKCISGEDLRKRPISVSMRLLEEFVLANGHFPYWNPESDEEHRLYRFVANRRAAWIKGTLTEDDAERWRAFEEKYRDYDVPRVRKRRSKYIIGDLTDVQDNLG